MASHQLQQNRQNPELCMWFYALCGFLPVLILSSCVGKPTVCQNSDFFGLYMQNGVAQRDADGNLVLALCINHHFPDCMAPDNFGHDMTVRLQTVEGTCYITGAESKNETFGSDTLTYLIQPANNFTAIGKPDLANPQIQEIILHDSLYGQSLFLYRGGYEFYENSLTRPDLEDVDLNTCTVFPATGSATYHWKK